MIVRSLTLVMLLVCASAQSAERDTAVIVNSGSTNRAGFRIAIDRAGTAEFTPTPRRRPGPPHPEPAAPAKMTIPRELADRLYADLKSATPLASLPAPHCMKSVSFGSRLNIEFNGEQSPDLSCPDNGYSPLSNLIRDCNEILALFQNK